LKKLKRLKLKDEEMKDRVRMKEGRELVQKE